MDVVRFHIGHIEHVRDDHVTRVAEDEVGDEPTSRHARDGIRSGEEMRRGDIQWAERVEPGQGLFGGALAPRLAFVFGIERVPSRIWSSRCVPLLGNEMPSRIGQPFAGMGRDA